MKVRLIQLLCPARHCIVATAYESADGNAIPEMTERLKETFATWVLRGANPWCGLCQSRNLQYEDSATKFATMTEALPHIRELERQQAATREYFRASRG